jgi:hypothetical protein
LRLRKDRDRHLVQDVGHVPVRVVADRSAAAPGLTEAGMGTKGLVVRLGDGRVLNEVSATIRVSLTLGRRIAAKKCMPRASAAAGARLAIVLTERHGVRDAAAPRAAPSSNSPSGSDYSRQDAGVETTHEASRP